MPRHSHSDPRGSQGGHAPPCPKGKHPIRRVSARALPSGIFRPMGDPRGAAGAPRRAAGGPKVTPPHRVEATLRAHLRSGGHPITGARRQIYIYSGGHEDSGQYDLSHPASLISPVGSRLQISPETLWDGTRKIVPQFQKFVIKKLDGEP